VRARLAVGASLRNDALAFVSYTFLMVSLIGAFRGFEFVPLASILLALQLVIQSSCCASSLFFIYVGLFYLFIYL
jgi:hypothetical protein